MLNSKSLVYCVAGIESKNVDLYKIICDVVNLGFFLCVCCRVLLYLLECPIPSEKEKSI